MSRRLASGLLVIPLVLPALAAAASLGWAQSGRLGADSVAVLACDGNGFSQTYTVSGGNVQSVTVGDIADPGCEGGSLKLVLRQGGGSIGSGGPVTVPTDADTSPNSVTVSVSPNPAAANVNAITTTVVGP
ncbi:MAG: hypothetical protein ACRDSN_12655 [Pseudonocardiaceae bacterium]